MTSPWRLITNPDMAAFPTTPEGWAARMASDQRTPEDVSAFEDWSLNNPEGREAYDRMQDLAQLMRSMGDDPQARRVLRRPRIDLAARRRALAAAFTAIAATLVVVAVSPSILARPDVYETRRGETRRVLLEDGSVITLNVNSRLRARMEGSERRLWLDQGQARFEVAHDAKRPFRVFAGDQEVRALGTVFDVRRQGGGLNVVLEQGVVALYAADEARPVSASDTPRPEIVLRPGQLAVETTTGMTVTAIDPAVTGAWRFGRMVFDNRPLGEAVAEINRYNARAIVIDDPQIAALKISGVFGTGDPEAFVQTVQTILPVEIAAQDGDMLLLRRREN